uniref:TLDc domain-containing protein n=1 Tax=Chaetoceros debilis TaxID=122233 RepID=A0A7S3V429_9STRA|mmetsp:Transcript_10644/g.15514  ORF Transcript_10644/g.15514 Transcript_10644/m.15514 type:complete len:610 (+) Transcript_10644:212-2041(+)
MNFTNLGSRNNAYSNKMKPQRSTNSPYGMSRPQSKNSLLKYTVSTSSRSLNSRSRSSSYSGAVQQAGISNTGISPPQQFPQVLPPAISQGEKRGSASNLFLKSTNPSQSTDSLLQLDKTDDVSITSSDFATSYNPGLDGSSHKYEFNADKTTDSLPSRSLTEKERMKSYLDEVERSLDVASIGSIRPSFPFLKIDSMDIPITSSNSIYSDFTADEDYQKNFTPSYSYQGFGTSDLFVDRIPSTREPISEHYSAEDDSNHNDETEVSLCIPIPKFVNSMIRKKRKRENDRYEKAAREVQSEKESIEMRESCTENSKHETSGLRDGIRRLIDIGIGDIGLALFIPLNWEAFEPLKESKESDDSSSAPSEEEDDDIMFAPDEGLESYPPILSQQQFNEISKILPPAVSIMTWKRAYSLSRDGDFFQTMYKKVGRFQHTLIVIKTDEGDILGGYADTPWSRGVSAVRTTTFFGGGRAFLYSTGPDLTDGEMAEEQKYWKPNQSIFSYRWTGENDYSQICDLKKGTIGMGGGGAFGFYVQEDFTVGSSGSCFTFRNPPLTKTDGGQFKIVDFEVYGFSSLAESYSISSTRSRSSSISSFSTARQPSVVSMLSAA